MSHQSRNILLVAGAHTLVCLAFLDYVCRSFGLSEWLLLVHAPLVVAALLAALIVAGTVTHLAPHRRGALYIAAFFPSIVVTALFAIDIVSFATNRWLAVGLTHSLVKLWMQALWNGEQLLPVSGGVLTGAAIVVAAAVILEILIWAKALKEFRLTMPQRPAAIAAVLLLTCGYAVFFQQVASRSGRSELIGADPIVAFLGSNWTVVDANQQEIFDRFRRDGPRRRAAYGRHTAFDRKNVIVITIDSLRADHLPLYGYTRPTTPFLSQLHDDGKLRRVEFATSTCAESNCGILSTLFSKTLRHQVAEDFSLFALLKDQGYDTHFVLSGNHDWMGQRAMYGDEHTSYFDGQSSTRYGWSDDRVLVEGLERIGAYQRPAFFFFHLMSPHIIGHKDERYRLYQPAVATLNMRALFRGEYDRTSVVNSYDNGIVEADATIRDLFSVLDRKGYLRNSIVVILADHGEALGERADNMYGHVNWLYQETLRIPMLIYDDSATVYQGVAFGTQLDVAPTLVDRLGLTIPADWEGVSLLRAPAPRQTLHQTKLTKPCFAIIDYESDRMLKYMQCRGGAREELYDLTRDAAERHDLAPTEPALIAGYRTVLDRWRNW
ncbi:MAG: sulfatase-like hydrolase/transferase [Cyanobacteria bacterium]|nr:sulfatase-like hydrolase/transferase [Cyanobacteriota bacterium]